ncbi:hypothetical protein LTR56_019399 [Elasticomyces elasticus]|nr:hypothetical protein LTR22_023425 [Elasticomyces elasticus]KAK3627075.1 hypothetical protein LTR56_019399 [Elasticomyces elasticus]KAK4904717.1 hypothetical protein LTR49_025888 [Elasticomyces elasticus]
MSGTAALDFGSPVRAQTSAVHHPPHRHSPESSAVEDSDNPLLKRSGTAGTAAHRRSNQRSATNMDNPALDRRGSVASRFTTMSSPDGMRHRKVTRSNTVTTYHEEPDHGAFLQPGAEPGIDTAAEDERLPAHLFSLKADCQIHITDFSDCDINHMQANNESLPSLLEQPRPDDLPCRWISVNGLSWDVIKALGNKYSLHRLAIEDLIHTHTRTKVDWYADHAFVVLTLQKLVRLHSHRGVEGKCDCMHNVEGGDSANDTKPSKPGSPSSGSSDSNWTWQRGAARHTADILPRYLDRDMDGKVDEFVQAHSGVSEETPIKPIRTLHRYESAQIPEHTAFMEKHSVLADEDLAVSVEQVSIFLLADNTVISFFEHSAEDVEAPLLERLHSTETMLRRSCDASLMLQALIDAIVDLGVPVKDAYNKARKELQVDAMTNPDIKTSRALHIFGEEIDMLQNLFKPMVHLVNALRDHQSEPLMPTSSVQSLMRQQSAEQQMPAHPPDPHTDKTKRDRDGVPTFHRKASDFRKSALKRTETATSVSITPLAHTYFGDVLDHCITMIQAMEQMDASAGNISTLIFNTVGAKTNNFMYILAVVTVFFAPLTFISGYFGMNFANGGGLDHPFGFFWVVAIPSLVAFMLLVFATMLWEKLRDFLAKRGIRAHRRSRARRRR